MGKAITRGIVCGVGIPTALLTGVVLWALGGSIGSYLVWLLGWVLTAGCLVFATRARIALWRTNDPPEGTEPDRERMLGKYSANMVATAALTFGAAVFWFIRYEVWASSGEGQSKDVIIQGIALTGYLLAWIFLAAFIVLIVKAAGRKDPLPLLARLLGAALVIALATFPAVWWVFSTQG